MEKIYFDMIKRTTKKYIVKELFEYRKQESKDDRNVQINNER